MLKSFGAALILSLFCIPAQAADCDNELKPTDTPEQTAAKLKCMRERAAAPGAKKPIAKATATGARVQELGGVRMELQGCSLAGADVSCRIVISTLADEEPLYFQRTSKALGENGVILKWVGYQADGQKLQRGDVYKGYKSGAKNKAAVIFKAADAPVGKKLAAVEIKYGRETFTFTDIALK